jgi:hypothetical protein
MKPREDTDTSKFLSPHPLGDQCKILRIYKVQKYICVFLIYNYDTNKLPE